MNYLSSIPTFQKLKMADSLKSFLENGKLVTSLLTVKLIKQLSTNSYVIADQSMVAILDITEAPGHSKYMNPGAWYKLIKCEKAEKSTIKINKTFKPIKTIVKGDIKDIDLEVNRLEQLMEKKASSKQYITLKSIINQPNHTKIDELTVRVTTRSRVITASKGNYQICNIKDAEGDNASINLYSKYLNRLEPFKIYTMTNLRKGEVITNGVKKTRLHTTGFTKIGDGNMDDSLNFQHISNGDDSITGVVIGFGETTFYDSCKMHHSKLDNEKNCPKCNKELDLEDILEDFRAELYLEGKMEDSQPGDIEVKEIIFFKRALVNSQDYTKDNIEEQLGELTGKTAKVDYNIDDSNRLLAVSIQLKQ